MQNKTTLRRFAHYLKTDPDPLGINTF